VALRKRKNIVVVLTMIALLLAVSETVYAQVQGNFLSGQQVGTQKAARPSNKLSHFSQYATGLSDVVTPIKRPSRDLLSSSNKIYLQGAVPNTLGIPGIGGLRTTARPAYTGLIRPTRPGRLNTRLSAASTMRTVGNASRSRLISSLATVGSLRPIRGRPTPFSFTRHTLLRPDLQQSETGLRPALLGSSLLSQQQTITKKTSLSNASPRNQRLSFSGSPTIFETGRRMQDQKQAPRNIFTGR
jgi:hypothetical protein